MPVMPKPSRAVFWYRTKVLTASLLLLWLLLNLVLPWWARDLNAFRLGGFPLGYWLVAEGALLAYLMIIVAYALLMDRLEDECPDDDALTVSELAARAGAAADEPGPSA